MVVDALILDHTYIIYYIIYTPIITILFDSSDVRSSLLVIIGTLQTSFGA